MRTSILALVGLLALLGCRSSAPTRSVSGSLDGSIDSAQGEKVELSASSEAYAEAEAHRVQGRTEQAIAAYDRAIELDATNQVAWVGRGRARAAPGAPTGAVNDFAEAIRRNQRSEVWLHAPLLHRGMSLGALGRFEEAEADLSRSLQLNPSLQGYVARGSARAMLADVEGGLADAAEIERRASGQTAALQAAAGIRLELGDVEGGCAAAAKACDLGACEALEMARQVGRCP